MQRFQTNSYGLVTTSGGGPLSQKKDLYNEGMRKQAGSALGMGVSQTSRQGYMTNKNAYTGMSPLDAVTKMQ